MESRRDLSIVFKKLSVTINILPFYGYLDDGYVLLNRLSKNSRKFWEDYREACFVALNSYKKVKEINGPDDIKFFNEYNEAYNIFKWGNVCINRDLLPAFNTMLSKISKNDSFTFDSIEIKVFPDFDIGKAVVERIEELDMDISRIFLVTGATSKLRFELPFLNPLEFLETDTNDPFAVIGDRLDSIHVKSPRILVRVEEMDLNSNVGDLNPSEELKESVTTFDFDQPEVFCPEPVFMIRDMKAAFPLLETVNFLYIPIDVDMKTFRKHSVFILGLMQ